MRCALLCLAISSAPMVGGAQATPIPIGTRVRVETRQDSRFDGTLMSQTADSVIVAAPGALRTVVPSGSIMRISVSDGKSHARGAVRGAKVGAVAGGGAMALIMGAAFLGSTENNKDITPLFYFVVSGAAVGAMYGVIIGGIIGAERWNTVYSSAVHVGFRPAPGGAPGVGLSIRF